MNENAKRWVEALQSGKYKQGAGRLGFTSGERCCLGVACDLAVEARIIPKPKEGRDARKGELFYGYQKEDCFLPQEVMNWLGLASKAANFIISRDERNNQWEALANLNDHGFTFSQIADIIKLEPEGLFE